jgi:acetyltransferase-like isoleucine patch superfamily enzyme
MPSISKLCRFGMAIALIPVPWWVRRRLMQLIWGYSISPSARIGWSIIQCKYLEMGEGSIIGHFNVIGPIDRVILRPYAKIGSRNRVFGINGLSTAHFQSETGRNPELFLESHASVVSGHHFDCCNRIRIGAFATIAGSQTQIFTHGIDVYSCRQKSAPVDVGAYSMIGTACVILKGAKLPDYSILAAGSVLNGAFTETHRLYQGVPALAVAYLPADALYFSRKKRHVD